VERFPEIVGDSKGVNWVGAIEKAREMCLQNTNLTHHSPGAFFLLAATSLPVIHSAVVTTPVSVWGFRHSISSSVRPLRSGFRGFLARLKVRSRSQDVAGIERRAGNRLRRAEFVWYHRTRL
jgi:hypothetical protein